MAVMRSGCQANGLGSTLTLPTSLFFVYFFSGLHITVRFGVTVRVRFRVTIKVRFGLRLRLGLGFIFYSYLVSTKPTVLSSCVTMMSQVAYE